MAITLTLLKGVDAEITAVVANATYVYFGTNEGEVWRYTISGGALTLMKALEGAVLSITLLTTTLYVAVKGGYLYSLTTS